MPYLPPHQPILIVEDSPEDYEATLRTFRKARLPNPVFHCVDGDEALDYLYQRGTYREVARAPRPGIILLDLNLPGTDGHEVLAAIKHDPHLKHIPVIVLTPSSDERDLQACYTAGANSCIVKPVDIDGLFWALEQLQDYRPEVVMLPNMGHAQRPRYR